MPVAFIAGAILVPFGFGLVPAFLPRAVPVFVRWCLWLIVFAVSVTFAAAMQGAPQYFGWMALGSLCLSMLLSLWLLIVDTRRAGSGPKG